MYLLNTLFFLLLCHVTLANPVPLSTSIRHPITSPLKGLSHENCTKNSDCRSPRKCRSGEGRAPSQCSPSKTCNCLPKVPAFCVTSDDCLHEICVRITGGLPICISPLALTTFPHFPYLELFQQKKHFLGNSSPRHYI